MMRLFRTAVLYLALAASAGPAFAVLPDEVLDDPALEERARDLSVLLRCMVCQNQSIDDSDAELARDLRVLVRERLVAGDTDDEVIAYIVSRYGEFVLLRPRFNYRNALLWGAPLLLLVAGGAAIAIRAGRPVQVKSPPLDAAEKKKLDDILNS